MASLEGGEAEAASVSLKTGICGGKLIGGRLHSGLGKLGPLRGDGGRNHFAPSAEFELGSGRKTDAEAGLSTSALWWVEEVRSGI